MPKILQGISPLLKLTRAKLKDRAPFPFLVAQESLPVPAHFFMLGVAGEGLGGGGLTFVSCTDVLVAIWDCWAVPMAADFSFANWASFLAFFLSKALSLGGIFPVRLSTFAKASTYTSSSMSSSSSSPELGNNFQTKGRWWQICLFYEFTSL